MPFSSVDNNELYLEMENKANLMNSTPSFSIQSLLDEMPGQNFETDEFLSDTISSKYFTPAEFLQSKLPPNKFSMLHINISSLSKHIDELRNLLLVLSHPFDVIGITETRLNSIDPLVNIEIPGYTFIHTPTTTQCGGAGIYIKTCYEFEVKEDLSKSISNVTESMFIELKRNGKKNLIIGCIYRHHTPIPTFISEFFEKTLSIISKKNNKICALMGDFNVDLVKYGSESNTGDFYDLLSSHTFRPLILQPTRVTSRTKTLIDNIFINDISCFSFGGNLTSSISDHYLQFAQTDIFETGTLPKRTKFARDFRNFNKHEFAEELADINWEETITEQIGAETSYQHFYFKIEEILNYMAPYRKLTQKEVKLEYMPWVTRGILKSMSVRDDLLKRRNKETDPDIKEQFNVLFKRYRNTIVTLLRVSKKNHYSSYFLTNQSNVKKTWDGIRNLLNVSKKRNYTPTKLIYKNEEKVSNNDIAESFNDFFVNVGSTVEAKIPKSKRCFTSYLKDANDKSLFLTPCTVIELLTIISNMEKSKSCGPNSISTSLLIEFSDQLVHPLFSIINMSLNEGVFPSLNKEADVCPIHKKNEKTKCENYRPISLLSNISKIFERVIYTRLDNFLNSSEIIYKFQFGFRKNYSTNHALLSIVEQIRNSLDKKMFACGVFIDLEKAFDTVNHQILLSKLYHYGIRGVANKLLHSYLSNRHQKVTINGESSTKLPITCGVPQGSILGPLLFLIYINDMHSAMEYSAIYHFADDTNLLYSSKSFKDLRKNLNKDLAHLYDWLCANRLSLNAGKTEFIVFRPLVRKALHERLTLKLHHSKLFESPKVKYLGLILDNKLSWKWHITELSKKLSSAVGMLYKIRQFCPVSVLRSLYFSLFNSHMSYGLVVWGNANRSLINKIKSLQKRALKCIDISHKDHNNINITQHNLKILTLDHQLQLQLSSLMWDYDNNALPQSLKTDFKRTNLVHNYSTRSASKGCLFYGKVNTTKYGIQSFKYQGIKILNGLKNMSIYLDSPSKAVFLKELKSHLLSTYI